MELLISLIEPVNLWLPKVIASFGKSNPDIHIKLLEVLGLNHVEAALQNYQVHLAITNQLFDNDEITTILIYKENLVVVLPLGYRL